MKESYQVAARRFGGTAGRVLSELRLICPQQQSTLLSQALESCGVALFIRVHTLIIRVFTSESSRRQKPEAKLPVVGNDYVGQCLSELQSAPRPSSASSASHSGGSILRLAVGLEKARSSTPITRHTNANVISMVIFLSFIFPESCTAVDTFCGLLAQRSATINRQKFSKFPRIRELQI
jgi:hypothetical protein